MFVNGESMKAELMFKQADELKRGELILNFGKPLKAKRVSKLYNPGKRTEIIHVRVELEDGTTALFPPYEKIEVE